MHAGPPPRTRRQSDLEQLPPRLDDRLAVIDVRTSADDPRDESIRIAGAACRAERVEYLCD